MFSNPERNLLQLGDITGFSVADLGAGSGIYSFVSAVRVGPSGQVYSVDVKRDLVKKIYSQTLENKIHNIQHIWGDVERPYGTRLADDSVDVVIASNLFFQLEDKDACVREISRILKNGGKVLFIDWADSFSNMGPHPNHIVDEAYARNLFNKRGFKLHDRIDAGDFHYGIIFIHEK